MEKLTIKELKNYRRESLVAELYRYQDLACNIDYIKEPIKSDIIQHNINVLEQVLIFKEI